MEADEKLEPTAARCRNCGGILEEGIRFCRYCGAEIESDFQPRRNVMQCVYGPPPVQAESQTESVSFKKKCPKCGEKYPLYMMYCPNDGCKLTEDEIKEKPTVKCPFCGKEYSHNIKFCPEDGSKLE